MGDTGCVSLQRENDFQLSTSMQGQHTMQAGIKIGILTLRPSLRTRIMACRRIMLASSGCESTQADMEGARHAQETPPPMVPAALNLYVGCRNEQLITHMQRNK